MTEPTPVTVADRLIRRRARVCVGFAGFFAVSQVSSLSRPHAGRLVDRVHLAAWVLWAAMLLVMLAVGGGLLRTAAVRRLMNDETTRAHRLRGMAVGFWAAIAAALLLYLADATAGPVPPDDALRMVITAAVSTGVFWFGALERRASRDG